MRAGTYARLPALPYVPGWDGAGIVAAVGPGLTGLKPGALYHYRVSATRSPEDMAAAESLLRTLPPPGKPLRVAVYGDVRSGHDIHALLDQRLGEEDPDLAILTGDLLFARASRIVARLGPEAVLIQAGTFERLCLGQLHETMGPDDGEDPVEHYLRVLSDKTGSLIATAGRFGAMFAGCGPQVVEVMVAYGEKVGVAFQLADDVLDLTGDGSGKAPGTDVREGVPTLPVLLVRQAAAAGDARAAEVVARLDADLSDDAALAAAVEALRAHPVTEQARAEAARWAREAVAALDPLPDVPARAALRAFAEAAADRTR